MGRAVSNRTTSSPAAIEIHAERLRHHERKLTRPRRAVLEVMEARHHPLTAAEIFAALPRGGCDLASVYRSLRVLEATGMVKRYDFGDGSARYELLRDGDDGHHHHLICTRCAGVVELDECLLGEIESRLATRSGFKAVTHRLEFFGLCPACQ